MTAERFSAGFDSLPAIYNTAVSKMQKGMIMKIMKLKKGDWFTKKPIEEPNETQVWVRDEYDRSTKKYICYRWSDIGDSCLMKGDKEVYTDFTF